MPVQEFLLATESVAVLKGWKERIRSKERDTLTGIVAGCTIYTYIHTMSASISKQMCLQQVADKDAAAGKVSASGRASCPTTM